MHARRRFQRRGIIEGFFGPLWSMSHRAAIFKFGAARGMNTYVYAPKDDPYHRLRWRQLYPQAEWGAIVDLVAVAQKYHIDFVYAFHPGQGLCFSDPKPVDLLLAKAKRFYDVGVRTFAVLFDDIPSRLEHGTDRKRFAHSLAHAEAHWLGEILDRQPATWRDVEWWLCPSYYTEDLLLPRTFGAFEPRFLETLDAHLPPKIPCFWTGPLVVSKTITLAHMREIARRVNRPLLLWDNYPVNDLTMSGEMHLDPLTGRDPRLPEEVYGYLNNPLLQETLSFIPLGTCFDYAADPANYDPERSWKINITNLYGKDALPHWRAIRIFCAYQKFDRGWETLSARRKAQLKKASAYIDKNLATRWAQELRPWHEMLKRQIAQPKRR